MADTPLHITITPIQYDNVPPDLQQQFDGLMRQSDALYDSGDLAGSKAKLFEGRKLLAPYERKQKTPDKDPPPPTGTSSAPPEGAHKIAEYRIVSLAPSVELTNNYPVPYGITALASNDKNYSPDVRFRGTPAMRLNSSVEKNTGDEPANGKKGIVSGARGGVADPITSSRIVKINGSPAIRDGDLFGMDKPAPGGPANTIGEGKLKRDTGARAAPGDERAWYGKGWDQFKAHSGTYQDGAAAAGKLGEWYDNPAQIGADLRSAYDSLPNGSDLWQGAKKLGERAVDLGGQVIADPVGSAKTAGGWAVDQGTAVVEGVETIYNKDGAAGVAGAGLGIIVDVASPSGKGKLLKEAAEGTADLAKAARVEKKAGDLAEAARAEKKAVEAGTPGLRVTEKKKRNPCSHLAKGNPKGTGPYRGGSYDGTRGVGAQGMESNHIPPSSVSPLGEGISPAIQMKKSDHRRAMSTGSSARAQQWREKQQSLIDEGNYRDAAAMDYKDARNVARRTGDPKKYNEALKERSAYQKCLEKHGILPKKKDKRK